MKKQEKDHRKRKALRFAKGFERATTAEQLSAIFASSARVGSCPNVPCRVCESAKRQAGASAGALGLSLAHLTPGDDFQPIPDPTHIDDWLHQYVEPRQSFGQWYSSEARNRVTPERRTIYFLPFGEFEDNAAHIFDKLIAFARIYFLGMEVALLPTLEITSAAGKLGIDVPRVTRSRRYIARTNIPWRVAHPYDLHKVRDQKTMRQLHAPPILTSLQHFLPDDAYCLLAFTMEDLYDGQRDSFVVGLASLESRVGLFSFARYDPAFRDKLHDEAEHENDAEAERAKKKRKGTKTEAKKKTARKGKEKAPVEEEEEDEPQADTAGQAEANRRLLIARSCKVMAHEVFHMFNIEHCVYYSCCMNGSGHVSEDDAQPMHLCPVDLHKLYHALGGLDVEDRYRQLRAFYAAEEMTREASWVDVRLATLSALERKEKEAEDDGRSTGGHQAQGETESGSDSGKEQVAPKKEGQVRRSSRLHHKSERATMVERLARR